MRDVRPRGKGCFPSGILAPTHRKSPKGPTAEKRRGGRDPGPCRKSRRERGIAILPYFGIMTRAFRTSVHISLFFFLTNGVVGPNSGVRLHGSRDVSAWLEWNSAVSFCIRAAQVAVRIGTRERGWRFEPNLCSNLSKQFFHLDLALGRGGWYWSCGRNPICARNSFSRYEAGYFVSVVNPSGGTL